MILLETENRIIFDQLEFRLKSHHSGSKVYSVDAKFSDFGGVLYHMSNLDGDKSKIVVSINLRCWEELKQHGAEEMLRKIYGNLLMPRAEEGHSVSLLVDLGATGAEYEQVLKDVALFRRHCFAAVFDKYFQLQEDQTPNVKPAVIHYREDESMYVEARTDRVTIIFSTRFRDADDVVIGKVFMQEFREGKKASQTAPHVIYSYGEPPRELESTDAVVGDNVGYITFVLFPRHTSKKTRGKSIDLMFLFRDYLHYHIKCSKVYIHSRMRVKTNEFIKVLNRARPEVAGEKKTIRYQAKEYVNTADRPWTQDAFNHQRELEERNARTRTPPLPLQPIPDSDWLFFKGDHVQVMVGRHKFEKGTVLAVSRDTNEVFVKGKNLRYRTEEKIKLKSGVTTGGTVTAIEQPYSVADGHVLLLDPVDARPTEVDWKFRTEGTPGTDTYKSVRVRVARRSERIIDIPTQHLESYEYVNPNAYTEAPEDTPDAAVRRQTFEPVLATFEDDVSHRLGIQDTRLPQTTFWY